MGHRSHQGDQTTHIKRRKSPDGVKMISTKRALLDTPGPVGERRRAEVDLQVKQELRRSNAHQRLKEAIAHLAAVTRERPMLSAEKTIAEAAQLEILSRLEEHPENLSDTVLNRMKDSAINSVARMEQWDRAKGTDPKDALAAITSQMVKLKGRLKIEVSVDPDPETIDVTPERPPLTG